MEQYQNSYILKEDGECEINLRDLLYYILRQWRILLLSAIVFCVLLGGFKFSKGFTALKNGEAAKKLEAYQGELDEYTINKKRLEDQVKVLTQSIKDKGEYYDQSILMNLNPDAAYKSTLTYAVDTAGDNALVESDRDSYPLLNQRINSILGTYSTLVQNGTALKVAQENLSLGLSQKQLAELVYVQTDYQAKLLHITIVGETQEQVQAITDAVKNGLESAGVNISSPMVKYPLELLSAYTGDDAGALIPIGTIPEDDRSSNHVIYQTSIEALQKDYVQSIADMQEQLFTCKEQLNKLKEPASPKGISEKSLLKDSLKFAIFGALGGAFLVAMFYAMQYLLSGKLMSSDCLNDNYGLQVLTTYHEPIREELQPIDKLIVRIDRSFESKHSMGEAYDIGVANIMAQLDKCGESKILLVGNAKTSDFEKAATLLKEKLTIEGVETIVAGNINESVTAVKKLLDADKVVLIEQCGASYLQDIQKEIQKLRYLKKEILGVVVL